MTTLLLGLVTGIGFGFALHRAGFKRPNLVQRGLWFRDFTMVQVMLTAIVFGLIGMYVMGAIAPELVHFKIKPLYMLGVVVGGLLFGAGIALAGYCPGTAMVGLASGRGEAAMAVLGALAGAAAYIFAYPALKPILIEPASFGRVTIPTMLGLPALPTALVFAAVLCGGIWVLARLQPRLRAAVPDRGTVNPPAQDRPAA
jgi:uncharacterized membrane protein YedE/YeeE